jgi:phenylpropionate dioxygenase-like ring-hydroxylating dioxygenase large terminal subunit
MNKLSSLNTVITSVNTANGLPNEHYTDQSIFSEEKRSVLFANWSGIGFGKDVPNAGDAKPVDFLRMPLLMVRDRDGSISVFQNTCRHRGMILVEVPQNIRGAIRCPYHSWCYGLNGELRSTPYVGGPGENTHKDIKREELGLVRIRSYVWRDVVFVNMDGSAPEFEEVHCDLMERWKEFDQPMYHGKEDSSFDLELNANWKLAIENFCESYHLPWVHPDLNSYSRLEDHYNVQEPGKYSGQGSYAYRQLTGADMQSLPDFKNLSEKWDAGSEYIAVYPNVMLGVQRDHAFAILLSPLDCEHTHEYIELYYSKPLEKTSDQYSLCAANAQLWKKVFEEDVFVIEGMQKGRHGEFFDGGRFSPAMDGPTHNFHHWIASQIKKGRGA